MAKLCGRIQAKIPPNYLGERCLTAEDVGKFLELKYDRLVDALEYCDPSDPCALSKCPLVQSEIVRIFSNARLSNFPLLIILLDLSSYWVQLHGTFVQMILLFLKETINSSSVPLEFKQFSCLRFASVLSRGINYDLSCFQILDSPVLTQDHINIVFNELLSISTELHGILRNSVDCDSITLDNKISHLKPAIAIIYFSFHPKRLESPQPVDRDTLQEFILTICSDFNELDSIKVLKRVGSFCAEKSKIYSICMDETGGLCPVKFESCVLGTAPEKYSHVKLDPSITSSCTETNNLQANENPTVVGSQDLSNVSMFSEGSDVGTTSVSDPSVYLTKGTDNLSFLKGIYLNLISSYLENHDEASFSWIKDTAERYGNQSKEVLLGIICGMKDEFELHDNKQAFDELIEFCNSNQKP